MKDGGWRRNKNVSDSSFILHPSDDGGFMSERANSSYEEIPYEGIAHYLTHPNHLAALARLFGMSPPEIETCRVLEVGCGRGENLIPMAFSLPRARFLGIDLSPG
jgi:tRNA G46 methylase TrmB